MCAAEPRTKMVFTFHIQDMLSPEMDALRLQCFPPPSPSKSSKDIYDQKSWHLTLQGKNTIAAYMRLTPGPNGVLKPWTDNKAEVPTGKHVIDYTRFLIHPDFRGLYLFESFLSAALHFADALGYEFVVGAFKVGRKLTSGGEKVGLLAAGSPVHTDEADGTRAYIQPVVCEIVQHRHRWPLLISAAVTQLESQGFMINYSTLDELIEKYQHITKLSNIPTSLYHHTQLTPSLENISEVHTIENTLKSRL